MLTSVSVRQDLRFARVSALRPLVLIPGAFVAGALWGTLARLWMRWIATDPAFSWSGTLFIVGAFAVSATVQSIVFAVQRRPRSRRAISALHVGGVLGLLPLFGAAGAIMMPTVIAGGLALWRTDWRGTVRLAAMLVATLPVIGVTRSIVKDFGISAGSLGRVALFAVLYLAVIVVSRSTFAPRSDGWRAPKPVRMLGWAIAMVPLLRFSIATIGAGTSLT